jgi:hypothetical protein
MRAMLKRHRSLPQRTPKEPLLVERKLVQPLWKTAWRFLKTLKIDLSYNHVISLLGIYLKEYKTAFNRDTCTPIFIAALCTTAELWKQPRYPTTDEWIKKM